MNAIQRGLGRRKPHIMIIGTRWECFMESAYDAAGVSAIDAYHKWLKRNATWGIFSLQVVP